MPREEAHCHAALVSVANDDQIGSLEIAALAEGVDDVRQLAAASLRLRNRGWYQLNNNVKEQLVLALVITVDSDLAIEIIPLKLALVWRHANIILEFKKHHSGLADEVVTQTQNGYNPGSG